ncbi:MAG: metallophosphoesterase [Anaerolineales bacterium]|jgi:Icc-related predicted phosphoesterase
MPVFSKQAKKTTRLFYATDVHGSERTFRKFLNAGKFYDASVLVMGGDIIGKMTIPIIQEKSGYRATLQGTVQHLSTQEELKKLQERIGTLGFYYKIMGEDEFHEIQANKASVDALFHDLARQRLTSWIELADTRLKGTGIKCYITGGNDDYPDVLTVLQSNSIGSVVACESKIVPIDETHSMMSIGASTPTPWKTPREMPDEELGKLIESLAAQVVDMSTCIFNLHDPPVDSTLDTCPQLDWNTDPPSQIVRAGQVVLHGAGSKSVRSAIEKHQPMLGLHGHIHESTGVVKIGKTLCVNPGSEYGEGILRGLLANLVNGKVDSYQLTSG